MTQKLFDYEIINREISCSRSAFPLPPPPNFGLRFYFFPSIIRSDILLLIKIYLIFHRISE
jgi:hypothetical protein